jgi:hypothetical protein
MKCLIIYEGLGGVQWHRLQVPFERMHLDGAMEVMHTNDLFTATEQEQKKLSAFDVAVFNSNITEYMQPHRVFNMLRRQGVKIVIDVDDYWKLPKGHIISHYYKRTGKTGAILWQIKNADEVWCTNKVLQKSILDEAGRKAVVIPNAIDPQKSPRDKLEYNYERPFYWGSVTHYDDLMLIKDMDIEVVGYARNEDGKIDPEWKRIMKQMPNASFRKGYKDVTEYHKLFWPRGVAVVPLKNTKFNRHKSFLKVIEAGYYQKPIITSDVHPYSAIGQNWKHIIRVKHPSDFPKRLKTLLAHKDMQDDLRFALHDLIQRKYMIWHTNDIRINRLYDLVYGN